MTAANGPAAETPGLRARIVVEREHFAVEVAVQVAVGETVAIMGPSGRGIVLLGQDARLFPHLSVRENVAFGPRAAGKDARAAREAADEWLARVGLPGAGDRMPRELSGGEGQRVAVARALAASPRAVLLDEPLVALDPATAGDIRQMLRDQLTGITTIAVTHDAADAVALAERLVVIEAGRVTQSGPVREVLSAPATGFVASIAGVNRLVGVASGGAWRGGEVRLTSVDPASRALAAVEGVALAAVFRPADVHVDVGAIDMSLTAAGGVAVGERTWLRIDPELVRFVAEF